MSMLHEHVLIACPPPQINRRLTAFFREHGRADVERAKVQLRLGFFLPGARLTRENQRAALATLRFRPRGGKTMPRYQIEWAAEEPGPYPLFYGTLSADAQDDRGLVRLELQGQYTPPLGRFEGAFDAVSGRTIAFEIAQRFLDAIKTHVETPKRNERDAQARA